MKKVTFLLIRIIFIVFILFLCLGFKNVFGYEQTYNGNTFYVPDEILENIKTLPEYSDDSRFVIVYLKDFSGGHYEVCFPFKSDFKAYMSTRSGNKPCIKFSDNSLNLNYYMYNLNTYEYKGVGSASSFYTGEILAVDKYYYFYCTEDIYLDSSCENLFYQSENSFVAPSFSNNIEGFENNSFQSFFIDPGDVPGNEIIKFTIRNDEYLNLPTGTSFIGYIYNIDLDENSPYYIYNPETNTYFYQVPKEDVIIPLLDKNTYTLMLFYGEDYKHVETTFTIGLDSDEEVILTDLNKTNKNIFNKIGDIFNLLNPFHENFFGRKLVELIIDGLKSLFIPENEYFSNYFNELNNWFSDRLGFLYYPLDVLFDLLNRFLSLSSENLVINIPEIKEPTTDTVLIKNQTFDFNTLLENEVLKNLHNIYLIIVDAIICFGLVNLLYKKYEEVLAR